MDPAAARDDASTAASRYHLRVSHPRQSARLSLFTLLSSLFLLSACEVPEVQQAECHIPGTRYGIATSRYQPTKFVGAQYRSVQLLQDGNPVAARQLEVDLDWFGQIGVFRVGRNRVNVVAEYDTLTIDLDTHAMKMINGRSVEGVLLGVFERDMQTNMLAFRAVEQLQAVPVDPSLVFTRPGLEPEPQQEPQAELLRPEQPEPELQPKPQPALPGSDLQKRPR
jgi:hypothetical protein